MMASAMRRPRRWCSRRDGEAGVGRLVGAALCDEEPAVAGAMVDVSARGHGGGNDSTLPTLPPNGRPGRDGCKLRCLFRAPATMRSLSELFDLTGRVALVTGGSRGLGEEMAEGLAEAGASLMLCARREQWLTPTLGYVPLARLQAWRARCATYRCPSRCRPSWTRRCRVTGRSTSSSTTPAWLGALNPRRCRWTNGRRSSTST